LVIGWDLNATTQSRPGWIDSCPHGKLAPVGRYLTLITYFPQSGEVSWEATSPGSVLYAEPSTMRAELRLTCGSRERGIWNGAPSPWRLCRPAQRGRLRARAATNCGIPTPTTPPHPRPHQPHQHPLVGRDPLGKTRCTLPLLRKRTRRLRATNPQPTNTGFFPRPTRITRCSTHDDQQKQPPPKPTNPPTPDPLGIPEPAPPLYQACTYATPNLGNNRSLSHTRQGVALPHQTSLPPLSATPKAGDEGSPTPKPPLPRPRPPRETCFTGSGLTLPGIRGPLWVG